VVTPALQDRAVHLWEAIADRYKDNPWIAGYNPVNEPADETILADQLDIYRRHQASWSLWTYKDIGRQGLATVGSGSPCLRRFGQFVAKKERLAADAWGSDGEGPAEVTGPFQELIAREFPGFDPYPWGRWDWVRTLLLTITVAQPLVQEYAELFRGLGHDELIALADSFALRNCTVREPLLSQLRADTRPATGQAQIPEPTGETDTAT
jgi:hypothetical protein